LSSPQTTTALSSPQTTTALSSPQTTTALSSPQTTTALSTMTASSIPVTTTVSTTKASSASTVENKGTNHVSFLYSICRVIPWAQFALLESLITEQEVRHYDLAVLGGNLDECMYACVYETQCCFSPRTILNMLP